MYDMHTPSDFNFLNIHLPFARTRHRYKKRWPACLLVNIAPRFVATPSICRRHKGS